MRKTKLNVLSIVITFLLGLSVYGKISANDDSDVIFMLTRSPDAHQGPSGSSRPRQQAGNSR